MKIALRLDTQIAKSGLGDNRNIAAIGRQQAVTAKTRGTEDVVQSAFDVTHLLIQAALWVGGGNRERESTLVARQMEIDGFQVTQIGRPDSALQGAGVVGAEGRVIGDQRIVETAFQVGGFGREGGCLAGRVIARVEKQIGAITAVQQIVEGDGGAVGGDRAGGRDGGVKTGF